jgi:DNA replication protein DnaC
MEKTLKDANKSLLKKREQNQEGKKNVLRLLQSEIGEGKIKSARRQALRYLHGEHKEEIIEMFRKEEIPTFQCQHCKRETERKFLPLFLMYDYNHKVCDDCNKKIVKAYEEQKLQDKMKALDKFTKTFGAVVDQMIGLSGVPEIFRKASMGDLGHAAAQALSLEQSYFIKGDVGVGKSHMAVALIRQYLESLKPEYDEQKKKYYFDDFESLLPCFIEVPELLLRIRDTYRSRTGTYIDKGIETEKDIVDYFTRTPYLVLDDLGSEKASEFSTLMLYLIINRRCTQGKTTVITSNLNLEQIGEHLSSRISSRINGMCVPIDVAGDDKRYEDKTEQGRANAYNTEHG